MSYDAKPIYFYSPSRSTKQIRAAMDSFLASWLPFHSSTEDLKLYHYTTLNGLKGILTNRSLWFTHTSTLNDPSELKYGKQLILDLIGDAINDENEDNIKTLLNGFSTRISAFDTISYQTYVACFCESENLLSQWRSYSAQGGGYNLGFRFQSDTKFYHTLDDSEKESYVILRRLIYDVDRQRDLVSNYLSSIVNSSGKANDFFRKHGGIPEAWASIAALESVNILFDLMLSFKNPVFSAENEWRLIKGMEAKNRPEILKFREADGCLVPYLEIFMVEDLEGERTFPLRTIKYGPKLDDARTKSALELLINQEASSKGKIKIDARGVRVSGAGYVLRD